jgi:redox-sensitive bicupin YhaK (pirin superfamily)
MMTAEQLHTSPSTQRRIAYRTKGHAQGPLTRLMSPDDLGELIKPFVFLDYFESAGFEGDGGPVHPHSGIATHTTLLQGSLVYGDSTGKSGTLNSGSVEWMQAGGGVWHGGTPLRGKPLRGFQLWVALPPALELAQAESHYVDSATVPGDGRVRVLLGAYRGMGSPILYKSPVASCTCVCAMASGGPISPLQATTSLGSRWQQAPCLWTACRCVARWRSSRKVRCPSIASRKETLSS